MTLKRLLNLAYGLIAAPTLALLILGLIGPLVVLGPTLAIRRAIGRYGVRLAFMLVGVPLRVSGTEKIPTGPCIAVANHASYVDGIVLTAALPPEFTFVVQDGASSWPFIGLVIRRMGVSFVNRSSARAGAAQTKKLIRRASQGEHLAIFAEGTFVDEPGLLAFKKGAFLIAARAQVPVVPVGIRGTRKFFGGGRKLPNWSVVEIEIADPIPASDHAAELRDRTRQSVLAICGEPDADQPSPKEKIPLEGELI